VYHTKVPGPMVQYGGHEIPLESSLGLLHGQTHLATVNIHRLNAHLDLGPNELATDRKGEPERSLEKCAV